MRRLKTYLLPIVVLSVAVAVVESFRTFFMRNIIEPIALLFWAAWRIVASVDQNVYWLVLILACFILVIRLLPIGDHDASHKAYSYQYRPRNRVDYWKKLMTDAMVEKEAAESLHDNLKKLELSIMAGEDGSKPVDLDAGSAARETQSSRPAHFLALSQEADSAASLAPRSDIIFLVPKALRKWVRRLFPWDTSSIDDILGWMETQLEITHEK